MRDLSVVEGYAKWRYRGLNEIVHFRVLYWGMTTVRSRRGIKCDPLRISLLDLVQSEKGKRFPLNTTSSWYLDYL